MKLKAINVIFISSFGNNLICGILDRICQTIKVSSLLTLRLKLMILLGQKKKILMKIAFRGKITRAINAVGTLYGACNVPSRSGTRSKPYETRTPMFDLI